ncbi:MAG: hypothetical protein GXC73_14720 [Chitinophagaceae bacterium]|nr:hypothetical protein [Chitinophagaceae bacterium]
MTTQARRFISDWILTGPEEKGKVFFDVWDIVLKSFLPTTRPILFRACDRISKNGKIASFTGSLECARRFSKGKGSLIICDTTKTIAFDEYFKKAGEYNHTFYPLANLLVKAKDSGGWEFSERILNDYSAEDEYIMRINLDHMHSVKWLKTNRQL